MRDYVRDAHGWEYFVCGREDWEGWTRTCRLGGAKCVALFDQHGLSDKLTEQESLYVGVELDHLNSPGVRMPSLLCFLGRSTEQMGSEILRGRQLWQSWMATFLRNIGNWWGTKSRLRCCRICI